MKKKAKMKGHLVLSFLLALVMMSTLIPAELSFASTSADAIADSIIAYNSNFTTSVNGNTVTVTGTVENANTPLTIDIPDGVTVEWNATLSGTGGTNEYNRDSLLNLKGSGYFILNSTGKIQCSSQNITTAIEVIGPALSSNGLISSDNGPAIYSYVAKDINISGGSVISENMNAICLYQAGTKLTVTGGSVLTGASMFSAISCGTSSGSMNVEITGGSVGGISSTQSVTNGTVPVYYVPVQVSDSSDIYDIEAYYTSSGNMVTYSAQTDESGYAYLWLPATSVMIYASNDTKDGNANPTVSSSSNSTVNISVRTPAEQVAYTIDAYNTISGSETNKLTTTISGNTITVSGSLTGVTNTLNLTIPEEVTLIWKAKLTGTGNSFGPNPSAHLLDFDNSGTVEIAEGAEITNSASKAAAVVSSNSGRLLMSGGKVTATASKSEAIAAVSGCCFTMTGGEVSANQDDSFAIMCSISSGAISGGTVSATGSNGKQLALDEGIVAYRSGIIQSNAIIAGGSSVSIAVEEAMTTAAPGTVDGLTITPYNLADGESLNVQWVPKTTSYGSETGINVYQEKANKVNFLPFSGVSLAFPDTQYQITFDANGGSGSMNNVDVDEGDDYSIAVNSFTRSDYSFVGWNTSADGSGTAYAEGATIFDVEDDITLYAQWSASALTIPEVIKSALNVTTPEPIEMGSISNGEFSDIKMKILLSEATVQQKTALANMTTDEIASEIAKATIAISSINTTNTSQEAKAKMEELKKNLSADAKIIPINFTAHAQFAFPVQITIQLDKTTYPAGTYYLYYYNPDTKNVEYCGKVNINENGLAEFTISHCSDYFISSKQMELSTATNTITTVSKVNQTSDTTTKTGDESHVGIYLIIGMSSLVILQLGRKKKASKAR